MNTKFPRNKLECCLKTKTNSITPANPEACLDSCSTSLSAELPSRLSMAEQWGSFTLG